MAKMKGGMLHPERREKGGFAAVPHCLLESTLFVGLSAHAVKLLMDLMSQFKGFNNGDLCLAWSLMKKRGWKSRDTLNNARKELLDKEIMLVSRRGDRKRPNLYALSFFAIDECNGKLDIKATERPLSLWRLHEPLPPLKIKSTHTAGVLRAVDMARQPGESICDSAGYSTTHVSETAFSENL